MAYMFVEKNVHSRFERLRMFRLLMKGQRAEVVLPKTDRVLIVSYIVNDVIAESGIGEKHRNIGKRVILVFNERIKGVL